MQSAEELISLLVKDVVENLVNKVASTRAKSEGASKVAALKGKAINAYDNRANQESILESFGETQSQLSDGSKSRKPSSRMLHLLTESCISKEGIQQNVLNCTKCSSRIF